MRAGYSLEWVLAVVALALGVGCGPASSAGGGNQQQPVAKPTSGAVQTATAAPPASGQLKRLLIGSTSSSSGQYPYWVAVGKLINQTVSGVSATVVETGGSIENINRARQNEFDVILVSTEALYLAAKGEGPFKDKAYPELRWLWVQREAPIAIIVREDSGIKTLDDLNGKDLSPGMRGSSEEKMIKDALTALGIRPKWSTGDTADAVQSVKDRRIVGYGKTMSGVDTIDASTLDIMTTTKIRVLPFTQAQVKKVLDAHPYYSASKILAGVFKDAEWNKEQILTLGSVAGGAATTRLPVDLGFGIAKAIDEDNMANGKKVQFDAYKAIGQNDFGKLTVEGGFFTAPPLHAGAYRWYKERGLNVPDAIVPPEAQR